MTFVDALHSALDTPHRVDTAAAVHDVVANALRMLDAGAEIKSTDYFTHTFVPDLVLSWGPGDKRQERHVHLRFSVTDRAFCQDLDHLASEAPLFLGMTDRTGLDQPVWSGHGPDVESSLVTQSPAIEELERKTATESRARKATGVLVRAGRGLLDEPRAERVGGLYVDALRAISGTTAPGTITATAASAHDTVELALTAINEVLRESGQLDLERTLQSEWIRHGGDPYEFPGTTPWNAELLDVESLREVLLGLLDSPNPVAPETWQRNAGFIRAEDIGRVLGRSLRGGAFNAMAHALLPHWTAKWVWAERTENPPLFDAYEWVIDNGILGLDDGDLRTFFADDGRHFKDKEGGHPLPLLSAAQQMLSQPGLIQVGLRGQMEGIRYEPLTGAGNVFDRIQSILSAPGSGSYRVQSLTTSVTGTDATADIDLDRHIIDLHSVSTPVATLARMSHRFFSRSERPEGLDHFLATGEPPPPSQSEVA
jgi:hypothetical protein